jgi:hypothetical protein
MWKVLTLVCYEKVKWRVAKQCMLNKRFFYPLLSWERLYCGELNVERYILARMETLASITLRELTTMSSGVSLGSLWHNKHGT